ncbi:Uncharacterised protein [Yersinia pseudotuberculosis]|uniref:hypothetical protein n=1 Tax=Yersinia pseudotuberculosis TaxID=633 RepID=UPI0005DB6FAD|nr:hypothetical protein [Yersinia pseudotuberculosis]CNK89566.1 Uncharacterised protein [Yersinia pseudotuberculosis]
MGMLGMAVPPSQASSDNTGCVWGKYCPLSGVPFLDVYNDTRVNMMLLVGEPKNFILPRLTMPADITRSRNYHFGEFYYDEMSFPKREKSLTDENNDSPSEETPFDKMAKTLGINSASFKGTNARYREARHISNNPASVEQFFTALLADSSLTADDRHNLALWRSNIFHNVDAPIDGGITPPPFNIVPGSHVDAFSDYLHGANAFYRGDYPEATALFSALQKSSQAWVAETATYMLFRVALNESSTNASDKYGMFETKNINQDAARQALDYSRAYLVAYPQGIYAESIQGLERRIYWYLSDWQQLARLYEETLLTAPNAEALWDTVSEVDAKFISKDAFGGEPFISDMQAPLLTFTQTLRWLRLGGRQSGSELEVTQEKLASYKPMFVDADRLPLWQYLQTAWLYYHEQDYAGVVATVSAVDSLPATDIVTFSQQILYGDALVAQQQWSQAEAHWRKLLGLVQSPQQQQYLQLKLAAVLVNSDQIEAIFTADSPIKNLRYRSLILKTKAQKALLQQQVISGANDEEKTIALHTLLLRDLMLGDYQGYEQDKQLSPHIQQSVDQKSFADVDLAAFDWQGDNVEQGYACAALDGTVKALVKNKTDGHALNCLGEFFRVTDININTYQEGEGNEVLNVAVHAHETVITQPNRFDYYQHVINDPKAEPEDKSYALYRAVMCYAPSGYNQCGGEDVDIATRKRWFSSLKTQYKGSRWAERLNYYW